MAKEPSATIDRIIGAASDTAVADGLATLTIGKVALRAGVSTALVHYHFDTKQALLVAAAGRIAAGRSERREAAFTGRKALAALDALWTALEADVTSGAERAWLELEAMARNDEQVRAALVAQRAAELGRLPPRLARLLEELGAQAVAGAEEMALVLTALLDGFAAALTAGESASTVRTAYDAFWLAMISAGQSPGGRRR